MNFNFSQFCFKMKPYMPRVMVAAGVISMFAGAIDMAIQTAKHSEEVLDDHEAAMKIIAEKERAEQLRAEIDPNGVPTYSEKQKQQDTMRVYGQTGAKFGKTYLRSFLLMAGGAGLIFGGFGWEYAMYTEAVATGSVIARDFKNYRTRVRNDVGNDKDLEYMYGIKKETVVENVINPDTGEEEVVKKEVVTYDNENIGLASCSFMFDEHNRNFDIRSPHGNTLFVKCAERDLTDELIAKGWLTLNEALVRCGEEPVLEGARLGWLYDPNDPGRTNKVIINVANQQFFDEVREPDGSAPMTLLMLNCDGDIVSEIETDGGAMFGWGSIKRFAAA